MSAAFDARLGPAAVAPVKPHLDRPLDIRLALILLAVLALGLFYMAYSIRSDLSASGGGPTTILPFLLLGVALLIALGFEFVNGFHDTANAVATVIYTHALPAQIAVVWSGCWNLLGVLASTGAVAFGIVSLLPVELILQVGSAAGYAMVFALLIAAIIWNLGTWWLGIPASSSHTLIGSIVGVGVANALVNGKDGTSGVDWDQVTKVGEALLFSPLFGFALSAILLLIMKAVIRVPELYTAPTTSKPPSPWIRGLLILTCTLVSFFHGSNDGQKGMGLIMLILIGVAPTAYALNRAPPEGHAAQFVASAHAASKIVEAHGAGYNVIGDPRPAVTDYVHAHHIAEGTYPSLAVLVKDISDLVEQYGSVAKTPLDKVQNLRNDMYLASEAFRVLAKDKENELTAGEKGQIADFKKQLEFGNQVHSAMGQDLRGDRARSRHHGRLEAHRDHRRREDRQDSSDLRPGRGGGAYRSGDDRRGRRLRPAGVDDPRPLVRRRRHDGRQRLGNAVVDDLQHRDGLGADAAGGDDHVRRPVSHLPSNLLTASNRPFALRGRAFGAAFVIRKDEALIRRKMGEEPPRRFSPDDEIRTMC